MRTKELHADKQRGNTNNDVLEAIELRSRLHHTMRVVPNQHAANTSQQLPTAGGHRHERLAHTSRRHKLSSALILQRARWDLRPALRAQSLAVRRAMVSGSSHTAPIVHGAFEEREQVFDGYYLVCGIVDLARNSLPVGRQLQLCLGLFVPFSTTPATATTQLVWRRWDLH